VCGRVVCASPSKTSGELDINPGFWVVSACIVVPTSGFVHVRAVFPGVEMGTVVFGS